MEAAELAGVPFDAVRWAPVAGFEVDLADADGDGEDEEVLYSWFVYDYDTHILDPSFHSFVVRTPDGDVRMWVETYYHPVDGNSGWPTFTWAWLTEPGPLALESDRLRVDASSGEWIHVNLHEQLALAPADPASSAAWDLALRGPDVALNGDYAFLNPGNGSAQGARVIVSVSPTGAPYMSLIPAITKPTWPVLSSSRSSILGVKHPTRSAL